MKSTFKPNPEFVKALAALSGSKVKVGWFPAAVYENGVQVSEVAQLQELGSADETIPARPMLRPTAEDHRQEWAQLLGKGSMAVLNGKSSASTVMSSVGAVAADDVRKTISQVTSPSLKDATVMARLRRYATYQKAGKKGRASQRAKVRSVPTAGIYKPLVDSGIMLNSCTYEVSK